MNIYIHTHYCSNALFFSPEKNILKEKEKDRPEPDTQSQIRNRNN